MSGIGERDNEMFGLGNDSQYGVKYYYDTLCILIWND